MLGMVNVGFGNVVAAQRIVAIVTPESAPSKRIMAQAREVGKLIDATHGRRTRAVIVMDSGHVILSSLQPQTIGDRVGKELKEAEIS